LRGEVADYGAAKLNGRLGSGRQKNIVMLNLFQHPDAPPSL